MTDDKLQPRGAMWFLIILALAVFAGAVMYFSRNNSDLAANGQASVSRPPNIRQPRTYTVFYGLGVFSPTNIRIHVGDSVRFQNDGRTAIGIATDITNGTPDLPGFESIGEIQPDGAFTFTFGQAGIFGYHNVKNSTEEGTIIVRP